MVISFHKTKSLLSIYKSGISGKVLKSMAITFFLSYNKVAEMYLDSVQAQLASLRELQSAAGEELSALLPSVLDKAFKGEL
jgi:hypothetical protein